jgi:LysM repeat protein
LRRQVVSWREIESEDYAAYVANLRDLGCPEQTIRDIIIADVNAYYARRRAAEILTPEQQWWRSQPDANVLQAAIAKYRELEEERRNLLGRLLGTNWESGDLVSLPRPTRPGLVLDGPLLGTLAQDTKQAVQDVNLRSADRVQAYLETQASADKTPDPVELAKLRQQTRQELAAVLSPAQLEEFLLRYSQDATALRTEFGQLGYFDVTSNEFRLVFRSVDPLDQRIELLSGNDPATVAQRNSLESARQNAIRAALGPDRYEEYRNLQDPLYQQAMAQAIEAGTPDAVRTIYEINLAAQWTQDDIRSTTNWTSSQQNVASKRVELEQLQANTLATGQELPPEAPAPAPSVPQRTYVIHPGDTAAVVSMIYGVPMTAIRQANPNLNLNRLRPGDTLVIPPAQFPPAGWP